MITFRRRLKIAPYYSDLTLNVSDDLLKDFAIEFPEMSAQYDCDVTGMSVMDGKDFWLFFARDLDHGSIAHEIFHTTHRILESSEVVFSPSNHEPFTYLCQHLTDRVYGLLRKANIRITYL